MANKLYEENSIRDIASAIREKNGTENTYNVAEMGQAIRSITVGGGGITPSGTIEITTNGTHDVTNYVSALVSVASSENVLPNNIKMGTFAVTENHKTTSPVTVSHNIGVAPIGLVVVADEIATIVDNNTKATIGSVIFGETTRHFISNGTKLNYSANGGISDVTSNEFTFTACADAYPVLAGVTYRWFAWT